MNISGLEKVGKILIIFLGLFFLSLSIYYFNNPEDTKVDYQLNISSSPKFGEKIIYDRNNILLSNINVTPGTKLIVDEVSSKIENQAEVNLAIDSELQDYVYGAIEEIALRKGYKGGSGIIMDVRTGELISLTSYSRDLVAENKATKGLFIPGSVIKPFVAIAALNEGLIDPDLEILSTGSITITDQEGKKLLFKDWKAHGYVDLKEAIGVSSNVYFYAVGGGYEAQRGLGINKIVEYLQLFGIGNLTGINLLAESEGIIPDPKWKEKNFNGDKWRLADTYLAAIGQHGYKVTPLQMTRAVAGIATEGELVVPTIIKSLESESQKKLLPVKKEYFKSVKKGMEYAVLNGTAAGLYMDDVTMAAKTGTAEVDINKEYIHSWLIGYFPYDKPKYAFTVMLDSGPWGEEVGAVSVAQNIFKWMREKRPEYLRSL